MKLAFDGIFWVVKYSAKGWYSDFFTAKEKNDVFLVVQVGVFFFFRSKFCPVTPFYWELRTCDPMKSNELSSSGEGSCLLLINSGPFSGLSWWSFESWDQKQRSQLFYICISQHLQVGVSILRHPKGCWIDTPCKAPLSLKVCISTCLFKTRQVLWIVDLGRSVKRWAWSEKRFLAGMEGSLVRLDWKSLKAEGVEFFRASNFSRCEVLTRNDLELKVNSMSFDHIFKRVFRSDAFRLHLIFRWIVFLMCWGEIRWGQGQRFLVLWPVDEVSRRFGIYYFLKLSVTHL